LGETTGETREGKKTFCGAGVRPEGVGFFLERVSKPVTYNDSVRERGRGPVPSKAEERVLGNFRKRRVAASLTVDSWAEEAELDPKGEGG